MSWQPNKIYTGIINPVTKEEYILSDYYVDATGNKHFTHNEAVKIANSVPNCQMCDNTFHQALYETVWDKKSNKWREDVKGSGLNGFEYLIQKLGYELGGWKNSWGDLFDSNIYAFCWSSSSCRQNNGNMFLNFNNKWINPTSSLPTGNKFMLRFLMKP